MNAIEIRFDRSAPHPEKNSIGSCSKCGCNFAVTIKPTWTWAKKAELPPNITTLGIRGLWVNRARIRSLCGDGKARASEFTTSIICPGCSNVIDVSEFT